MLWLIPLLSQSDMVHAGWLAVVGVLSGIIGTAGTFLLNAWVKRRQVKAGERKEEREERRADENREIEGLDRINARHEKELGRLGTENRRLQSQLNDTRIMAARMLVWLRHLEEMYRREGKPFRTWDEVVKDTAGLPVEIIEDTGGNHPGEFRISETDHE